MSSITSLTPSGLQSPRARMDARISAAASTGSISATDQAALGSALDTINSSLSAGGAKQPGDMKAKIDDLIQKQVDSGALTADQASELQGFFAKGAGRPDQGASAQGSDANGAIGGVGGPKGPGGAHHAHGHRGPRPTSDDDTDSDSTTGTTDSTSTDSTGKQLDALMSFLEQLRDSVGASATTYGSNASTSSNPATGLVIDTTA